MAKGVKHFKSSGKPYTGATHVMSDGTVHTGATHTKNSVRVFHKAPSKKKPSKSRS